MNGPVRASTAGDVEPRFHRHADIEKDDVRLVRPQRLAGLLAVGALGYDHDVRMAFEQLVYESAGERFVVGDERPNHDTTLRSS